MNKLWYMGFLSLVSALYFVTGKAAFLWFAAFAPYFALYSMSDERLEANLGKATTNAFLFTVVAGVAVIAYVPLAGSEAVFAPAFVALVGGTLLACLVSLFYYDKWGTDEDDAFATDGGVEA